MLYCPDCKSWFPPGGHICQREFSQTPPTTKIEELFLKKLENIEQILRQIEKILRGEK